MSIKRVSGHSDEEERRQRVMVITELVRTDHDCKPSRKAGQRHRAADRHKDLRLVRFALERVSSIRS
jgi:hypothetical protein